MYFTLQPQRKKQKTKKQPTGGFEPPTFRLLSECSTPKLRWLGYIGDNMAEWLRRQPAKLMGFARVGSNPTVVGSFFQ